MALAFQPWMAPAGLPFDVYATGEAAIGAGHCYFVVSGFFPAMALAFQPRMVPTSSVL
jgi:hypothetical protein